MGAAEPTGAGDIRRDARRDHRRSELNVRRSHVRTRPIRPPLDPRLLEILVCPLTKGPLEYDREAGELISRKAGLAYPVRDGIPIMLVDEARKLEE